MTKILELSKRWNTYQTRRNLRKAKAYSLKALKNISRLRELCFENGQQMFTKGFYLAQLEKDELEMLECSEKC